jgi:hypothetical protein
MPGKLSVGEVLGEVFALYRAHAGVLLPIAFWLFLVVAIGEVLAIDNFALAPVFVLSTVVGFLYQGIVVGLVRDVRDRREAPSAGEVVRSVLPVLLRLAAAGVLATIGMLLGLIVFVVPGLIALTFWAVIAPAIVIERTGVFAAFSRSNHLVSGNGWPVFGSVMVANVIAVGASLAFAGIAEGIADGPIVAIVLITLAWTVTAPVAGLLAAVLYYRLLAIEQTAAPAEPADVPAAE